MTLPTHNVLVIESERGRERDAHISNLLLYICHQTVVSDYICNGSEFVDLGVLRPMDTPIAVNYRLSVPHRESRDRCSPGTINGVISQLSLCAFVCYLIKPDECDQRQTDRSIIRWSNQSNATKNMRAFFDERRNRSYGWSLDLVAFFLTWWCCYAWFWM